MLGGRGGDGTERRARRDDVRKDVAPGCRGGRADRSAQPPATGSKHCVVVALVNSVVLLPQSQWWKRSGISNSRSAAASAGSFSAAMAASSKIVLIGSSWIPVRS